MGNVDRTELFEKIIEAYLSNNNVIAFVDKDGDLLVKSVISTDCSVYTFVVPEKFGYYIHSYYGVGSEQGHSILIEKVNEINCNLREGALMVRDNGEIQYRSFIPDIDADAVVIMRSVKTSVATFLEHLGDFIECVGTIESIANSDYRIIDPGVVG